jgi:hypothetical protein
MAPDTQSIDCNRTFLTLGLALSHPFGPFDNPIEHPSYADNEVLSAAIKRADLDDDDEDDEDDLDEEEDDDLNEEDEDHEDDDEEYDDEDEDDEDEDEDEEEDEDEDDIKLI